MIGEIVLLDTPDHAFNVLNRDQSTPYVFSMSAIRFFT
jgi:hypothetical protein